MIGKKLVDLLAGVDYKVLQGKIEHEVKHIAWDTRTMVEGALFICVKNRNVDRHCFAQEAIKQGATILMIEHEIDQVPEKVTIIQVDDSRKAMSIIAQNYYEKPGEALKMIGVTGTNGKTSITHFIAQVLSTLGEKTGVIGTIRNTLEGEKLKTKKINPTTPDAIELQASLKEMLDKGATYGVMEVTSSALAQNRVYGMAYQVGVFTNLTQDHLEEHGTMEAYGAAKLKLFKNCRIGIVNQDDLMAEKIKQEGHCKVITYGIDKKADFKAEQIHQGLTGVDFKLIYLGKQYSVNFPVPGRFSVYNALATIATLVSLGYELTNILEALHWINEVPGRFQIIPNTKGVLVVVDYAHSPDSLKQLLQTTKDLISGKLTVVFGCGGDRDTSKRAEMGTMAGAYSDLTIITSDNPRNEKPEQIMADIEKGILEVKGRYEMIKNRKLAIVAALAEAEEGDAVVIAGKGHETYQLIGNQKWHLDDCEIVSNYLNA